MIHRSNISGTSCHRNAGHGLPRSGGRMALSVRPSGNKQTSWGVTLPVRNVCPSHGSLTGQSPIACSAALGQQLAYTLAVEGVKSC